MKNRISKTLPVALVLLMVLAAPAFAGKKHRHYHGQKHYHSSKHYHSRGYYSSRPTYYRSTRVSYGYYGAPYYAGGYYQPYYYGPRAVVYAAPRPVYVDRRPVYVERGARSTAEEVQRELAKRGYYGGVIDGQVGGRTRAAIRAYQVDRGLPVTGRVDGNLLRSLRLL